MHGAPTSVAVRAALSSPVRQYGQGMNVVHALTHEIRSVRPISGRTRHQISVLEETLSSHALTAGIDRGF